MVELDWQYKAWGKTRCLVASRHYQRHEVEAAPGGYCSVHYHRNRANRFIVNSGELKVISFYAWHYMACDLSAGMEAVVASLVPHIFIATTLCSFVEEYYSDRGGEVELNDIVRLTKGGEMSVRDLNDVEGFVQAIVTRNAGETACD